MYIGKQLRKLAQYLIVYFLDVVLLAVSCL